MPCSFLDEEPCTARLGKVFWNLPDYGDTRTLSHLSELLTGYGLDALAKAYYEDENGLFDELKED